MMRDLYAIIDQLDLAARQLHIDDPSYSRFALILTDNAVELMVHRKAEAEIRQDIANGQYGGNKFSASQRKDVLGGQFLEPKTGFVRHIGWITEAEQSFIDVCHEHRNVLYHVGIRHRPIIRAVAWTYHGFACELFGRYTPRGYRWCGREELSEAVRRHTGGEGFHVGSVAQEKNRCVQSLKDARPLLPEPLPVVVGRYAEQVTEEVAGALQDLMSDANHDQLDEHAYIRELQFYAFMEQLPDEDRRPPKGTKFDAFIAGLKAKHGWRPKMVRNQTDNWCRRAEQIERVRDPIAAMNAYRQLRQDMDYLGGIITDAAVELSIHQQLELDMRRGK